MRPHIWPPVLLQRRRWDREIKQRRMRVDAKAAKSRDLPLPDLGGAFPLIAWENDVSTVEKEEGMELRELRRLMYRWGRALEFCAAKQKEIEGLSQLIDGARGLPGIRLDGFPGGATPGDPTAAAAARVEEIVKRYIEAIEWTTEAIDRELSFKRAMDEVMQKELTGEQRRILTMRYQDCNQWLYISIRMNMAESTVYRLEAQALGKIKDCVKVESF